MTDSSLSNGLNNYVGSLVLILLQNEQIYEGLLQSYRLQPNTQNEYEILLVHCQAQNFDARLPDFFSPQALSKSLSSLERFLPQKLFDVADVVAIRQVASFIHTDDNNEEALLIAAAPVPAPTPNAEQSSDLYKDGTRINVSQLLLSIDQTAIDSVNEQFLDQSTDHLSGSLEDIAPAEKWDMISHFNQLASGSSGSIVPTSRLSTSNRRQVTPSTKDIKQTSTAAGASNPLSTTPETQWGGLSFKEKPTSTGPTPALAQRQVSGTAASASVEAAPTTPAPASSVVRISPASNKTTIASVSSVPATVTTPPPPTTTTTTAPQPTTVAASPATQTTPAEVAKTTPTSAWAHPLVATSVPATKQTKQPVPAVSPVPESTGKSSRETKGKTRIGGDSQQYVAAQPEERDDDGGGWQEVRTTKSRGHTASVRGGMTKSHPGPSRDEQSHHIVAQAQQQQQHQQNAQPQNAPQTAPQQQQHSQQRNSKTPKNITTTAVTPTTATAVAAAAAAATVPAPVAITPSTTVMTEVAAKERRNKDDKQNQPQQQQPPAQQTTNQPTNDGGKQQSRQNDKQKPRSAIKKIGQGGSEQPLNITTQPAIVPAAESATVTATSAPKIVERETPAAVASATTTTSKNKKQKTKNNDNKPINTESQTKQELVVSPTSSVSVVSQTIPAPVVAASTIPEPVPAAAYSAPQPNEQYTDQSHISESAAAAAAATSAAAIHQPQADDIHLHEQQQNQPHQPQFQQQQPYTNGYHQSMYSMMPPASGFYYQQPYPYPMVPQQVYEPHYPPHQHHQQQHHQQQHQHLGSRRPQQQAYQKAYANQQQYYDYQQQQQPPQQPTQVSAPTRLNKDAAPFHPGGQNKPA